REKSNDSSLKREQQTKNRRVPFRYVELQSAASTLPSAFFSILLNETYRAHWRFHLDSIYLKLLILIVVANLAPIVGQRMLRNRFASPLDCGLRFLDGRPLLGPSKTWRGYFFSILITNACAWLEGLDIATGLVFALAVLLGDNVTSFIKRRLGLVSGGHAPGLDQILESLLPLLVVQHRFDLDLSGILGVVLTFIILNLFFWRYYRPVSLAG